MSDTTLMSDTKIRPIAPLPDVMVAPTGARRTREDHPALPITVDEICRTAKACWDQGATGIHVHVRDDNEKHILDSSLYAEAIAAIESAIPEMYIQITTEAVGQYTASEQRQLIRELKPGSASISLTELYSDNDPEQNREFLAWCRASGVGVQFILYSPEDLIRFESLIKAGDIANGTDGNAVQLIYVLGRYTKNQQSQPEDLQPLTDWLSRTGIKADWAVCAFGVSETACLVEARRRGGKVRVGFENSLWHRDGQLANSNAERVAEVVSMLKTLA